MKRLCGDQCLYPCTEEGGRQLAVCGVSLQNDHFETCPAGLGGLLAVSWSPRLVRLHLLR